MLQYNGSAFDGAHISSDHAERLARARATLDHCLSATAGLLRVDHSACEQLRQKFTDMTFNLVVAGQFKRGKSSVLNALLGGAVLPVGVVPLTSIVTVVRFGHKPSAHVELEDGREQIIAIDALDGYVTERGNPRNARHVRQVVVNYPSPWLANGVRLIDTPGIGSVYEHNTDVARRYLPQADAVLFIASADQPLGRAELDFLIGIRDYADKIFCLLNKTDYLTSDELNESLAFAGEQIRATLGSDTPLLPISARLALAGQSTRSGFPAFERALRTFMIEEKADAWIGSIGRNLLRILSQVRFTLQLEASLLTAPRDQLDRSLQAFRQKRAEVERSGTDYQVLLEADARTFFVSEVELELLRFKTEQQTRIGSAVETWYGELKRLSSADLQKALEQRLKDEVRLAYDSWLASEDAKLRARFEALCTRVWSHLQTTVDELIRYSSELFAVAFEPVRADAHFSTESGFYYKFWYEPTSLKILSTSAVLVLPKSLAARLIVKRTQARAAELIEAHAGRIRHDLEERLKKSISDVRQQIGRSVESIVARIEVAIYNGIAARRRSDAEIHQLSENLTSTLTASRAIEERVRAVMA
jgi:GTP-binding protein EngB required for normal cell division